MPLSTVKKTSNSASASSRIDFTSWLGRSRFSRQFRQWSKRMVTSGKCPAEVLREAGQEQGAGLLPPAHAKRRGSHPESHPESHPCLNILPDDPTDFIFAEMIPKRGSF